MTAMVTTFIDGSVLEGGGQIVRNAVALSGLLQKPVSITKIRQGRKPPGLKNQHRTGLELAARICNANLVGAENGSTEVNFRPRSIQLPRSFLADSITAGSTTLLLQIALPLLLFSPNPLAADDQPPTTLTLLGGTNATLAPQIDYTHQVFLPFIARHFGVDGVDLEIKRRGYFPQGGGEVVVRITKPLTSSKKMVPIYLVERGKVLRVGGVAHFARLPGVVGEKMVEGAKQRLMEAGFAMAGTGNPEIVSQGTDPHRAQVPVEILAKREQNEASQGPGNGIVLWADLDGGGIVGGSAVGHKGADPWVVGTQAAEELIKGLDDGGCVDELLSKWLQDQIIIFMALAHGKSAVKCGRGGLSLHTRTAIWLAQRLTNAVFDTTQDSSGHVIIHCEGIGYTP